MDLSYEQLAEAFSRHDFAAVYPHMADDIRWNLIGGGVLVGREVVKDRCEQTANYLAQVSTTFISFSVIPAGTCVVVESLARYSAANQAPSTVASCDVYRFSGDRLSEMTSYNIELTNTDTGR